VYTRIAKLVLERVAEDAAKGDYRAIALLPTVDRRLVKQTVMTCVYGVTYIGARLQIQSRLREKGWEYGDDLTYRAACYGATVRFRIRVANSLPCPS
jgi:DNA-directed RNA polymerase, mitochondrial